MNELVKALLEKKGTTAYRIILVGLVLWFGIKKDFVTVEDYKSDKKAQVEVNEKVTASLTSVQTTLKIMAAQDETLKDHETRIRVLEKTVR